MLLDLFYVVAMTLASPWWVLRALRTGRYRRELRPKFLGLAAFPGRDHRPIVWFHGVSVGEVHLLRPIVRAFRQRHPDWQIVVSATTDPGLAEARKHFHDLTVIPFPFDFSWAVRRSLRAVAPRLVILAESELWPNFLSACRRTGIPVVVVNGRMSPRSQQRLARFGRIARRWLLEPVCRFGMQSQAYADNLIRLGVDPRRVRVTGNVKYDGVLLERDNPATRQFRHDWHLSEDTLIWVAGSTHDPEEEIVLRVFPRLRQRFPGLRLILVPRAPERFDEVARLIEQAGFNYLRRSRGTINGEAPPVFLVDTMGELNAVWGLATIGFTGGSLNDRRGGQSMIEPAALGVPVLFGPHTWNFRDAVAGLLACAGAVEIRSEEELEREAARLLADASRRQQIGAAARQFVLAQQGATQRTIDLIDEVLSAGASIG